MIILSRSPYYITRNCVHVFAQYYVAELKGCLDPLKQKLLIYFYVFTLCFLFSALTCLNYQKLLFKNLPWIWQFAKSWLESRFRTRKEETAMMWPEKKTEYCLTHVLRLWPDLIKIYFYNLHTIDLIEKISDLE